jgi:hypothetical protein
MCEHLAGLDNELREKEIKEIFRGQSWTANCREWVYYDCVLDLEAIRRRHSFPDFVIPHINTDEKSGTEAGFVCERCQDGIMGILPAAGRGKVIVR